MVRRHLYITRYFIFSTPLEVPYLLQVTDLGDISPFQRPREASVRPSLPLTCGSYQACRLVFNERGDLQLSRGWHFRALRARWCWCRFARSVGSALFPEHLPILEQRSLFFAVRRFAHHCSTCSGSHMHRAQECSHSSETSSRSDPKRRSPLPAVTSASASKVKHH